MVVNRATLQPMKRIGDVNESELTSVSSTCLALDQDCTDMSALSLAFFHFAALPILPYPYPLNTTLKGQ